MNWHWDEKKLHRAIGVGVWVVIAAIVMPGLMKRADKVVELTELKRVELPTRPPIPDVKLSKAVREFQSNTLAKVDLNEKAAITSSEVAQAKGAEMVHSISKSTLPKVTLKNNSTQPLRIAKKGGVQPSRVQNQPPPRASFGVQLGSFANKQNADMLISSLKHQGFDVRARLITLNRAPAYKVIVTGAKNKDEALALQKRLTQATKINGIIINIQQG
jgi:cell division septation protein DedD